jgi:hypothetical protein
MRGIGSMLEVSRSADELQWRFLLAEDEVAGIRSCGIGDHSGIPSEPQDELTCGPVHVPHGAEPEPSAEMSDEALEAAHRMRMVDATLLTLSDTTRVVLWLAYGAPVEQGLFALIPTKLRRGDQRWGPALCNLVPLLPGLGPLGGDQSAQGRSIAVAAGALLDRALTEYTRARARVEHIASTRRRLTR